MEKATHVSLIESWIENRLKRAAWAEKGLTCTKRKEISAVFGESNRFYDNFFIDFEELQLKIAKFSIMSSQRKIYLINQISQSKN